MKTIGLVGGMSWESSAEYYRVINQLVARRLGGLHSAQIVLYSVDFAEIEKMQDQGRWDEAADQMIEAAQRVARAGADFVLLCTNTMHLTADAVQQAITIPLLHIADGTADRIVRSGLKTVGLLGTRFTMEKDFYRVRLRDRHGLEVLVPEPDAARQAVHSIIYDELCLGLVHDASREIYRRVIEDLVARGAEAVILGCTGITLLISQADSPVPVFDTTVIHAETAVDAALESLTVH